MDGTLIHAFIETLVWPVILLAVFLFFKREMKQIFNRLSKLSFGDVSVELTDKVNALQDHAERIENQKTIDRDVEAMVDVQLSETQMPPFSEQHLTEKIKCASENTHHTIYKAAKEVRGEAWRSLQAKRTQAYPSEAEREEDLELARRWMRRTIPIFRALTETERGAEWHRNYAQLGYALKDTGDIRGAYHALGVAIQQWKSVTANPVSPLYQFNWVYCEVRLDNERNADGVVSGGSVVQAVKTALKESCAFPALVKAVKADPEIRAWLDRNGLGLEWLGDD